MTVWIVNVCEDYVGDFLLAIFSTEEEAQKCLRMLQAKDKYRHYEVSEQIVLETLEEF